MDKSFRPNDDNNMDDSQSYSQSPPFVSQPKGYELSGKIMLSAIIILFAVVVIMVCLHIYARWYILRARRRNVRRARRRTHLVFYIEPNNVASNIAPLATHGLDPSVIKSLPTFVYDSKMNNNVKGGDVEEVLECAVCLSEFEEGEKGRMLPKCNHCFHVDCIDMWFHSHDTCPLCRAPVDPDDLTPVVKESENPSTELSEFSPTQVQLSESAESSDEVGPSRVGSLSFGGRRKAVDFVGVTIEVPRRCQSFSFINSDESGSSRSPSQGGFRSPLSLKRIFSRERKSPLPSPSQSQSQSTSRVEFDIESGRVEPVTPTS
ncbi:RING-H2 finger protein ATL2-like [Silene latifolia]|uniref:RING-H2 finger protein ATL2-like n=1 Tax=Silene latifolia TaxID=37657 RepID=UPI003D775BF3